jgi:hypothetical protein
MQYTIGRTVPPDTENAITVIFILRKSKKKRERESKKPTHIPV